MGILDKIRAFVVKKYLLGYLIKAYQGVNGNKTQIIMALGACVWVAARLNYVTPDQERNLYEIFGGAGTITLLAKLDKWKSIADELGDQIQVEKLPK